MSDAICRMYGTSEAAAKAAAELRQAGFNLVTEVGPSTASTEEGLVRAIMAGMVIKGYASTFAKGVLAGGTLVSAHAPFGTVRRAEGIMDAHGPIPSGVAVDRDSMYEWDDAAPMSSALMMPVLLPDSTSFSNFWGVPALLTRFVNLTSLLGMPMLTAGGRSFSPFAGMPSLTKSGPSFPGIPLLWR